MSGIIHRYVPAADARLTLLLLHGEVGDENDLVPIGQALAPGAALISPRLSGDDDAAALADFVEGFPSQDVIALGYSSGANLAAALLLRSTVLAGAILLRPTVFATPESLPDLTGKSVSILAGEHDAVTQPETTKSLASLLTRAGAQVEVRWMDSDHDLGPGDFQAIKEFVTPRL